MQYITDNQGETTGVYIPIDEWNQLREEFKGLEKPAYSLPEWHKQIIDARLRAHEENPEKSVDADQFFEELNKGL